MPAQVAGSGVRPAPKRPAKLSRASSASSVGQNDVDPGKTSQIRVSVRVRPQNDRESNPNFRNIISILDEHVLVFDEEGAIGAPVMKRGIPNNRQRARNQKFYFANVFGEEAQSKAVYERTAQPLIPFVLSGYNATVFCYGATGSGKTHTMIGYEGDSGVMVQSMNELFSQIARESDKRNFTVTISYLEVYNEDCFDLLSAERSAEPLKMLEGKGGKFDIPKLSRVQLTTAQEVMDLLLAGNNRRKQSATEANQNSSRSHAILQVEVSSRDRMGDITNSIKTGKLSLIDLAGSERACVSKNKGMQQTEGANINRSLLALGNCISVLAKAKGKAVHVPYRDSKLTRILKDSLGGNTQTVMIANVSPSSLAFEDTLNTLRYAGRATEIQTTATRNVQCVDSSIRDYQQIIAQLRDENRALQTKIAAGESISLQMDNKELELIEAKNKMTAMETLLYQLREVCMEQYQVLKGNNLLTDKLHKEYVEVANKVSPGKQHPQAPPRVITAWAASSSSERAASSSSHDERLINKNFFREHDRLVGTSSSPPSTSSSQHRASAVSPVRTLDLGSSLGGSSATPAAAFNEPAGGSMLPAATATAASARQTIGGNGSSGNLPKVSYADVVKSTTPLNLPVAGSAAATGSVSSNPSTPMMASEKRNSNRRLSSSSYILVEPARRSVPGIRPASEDNVVQSVAPAVTASVVASRPRNLGPPQRVIDMHQQQQQPPQPREPPLPVAAAPHPFGVPGSDQRTMAPPSAKPAGYAGKDSEPPKSILKNRHEKPYYKHDRIAAVPAAVFTPAGCPPAKKNARFEEGGDDGFQIDPNAKASIFSARDSGSTAQQVRHSVIGSSGFMAPTKSSVARFDGREPMRSNKRVSMIEYKENKENTQPSQFAVGFKRPASKSSPQAPAMPPSAFALAR